MNEYIFKSDHNEIFFKCKQFVVLAQSQQEATLFAKKHEPLKGFYLSKTNENIQQLPDKPFFMAVANDRFIISNRPNLDNQFCDACNFTGRKENFKLPNVDSYCCGFCGNRMRAIDI